MKEGNVIALFVGTVGNLWDTYSGKDRGEPRALEREVQIQVPRFPRAKEHHEVGVVASTLDGIGLPYGLEQRWVWGQGEPMRGCFCHSRCVGWQGPWPGWWPQNKSWRQMGVPRGCSSTYTQLMVCEGYIPPSQLRTMSPLETRKAVISKAV